MSASNSAVSLDRSRRTTGNAVPLAIIGVLFFIFGFVTWLNGSLIPFLKIICDLTTFEALLVSFVFYIAYTVLALPMAAILKRTGYRNGMGIGLATMAAGSLIHIPAAYAASFPMFLLGLFTLGAGLTILQTAANPYIVLLGPIESAASRISVVGIINKGAGVIVPLVFATLVLKDLGDPRLLAQTIMTPEGKHMLAARLVVPYLVMAIVLLALVALIRLAPLPEITPDPDPAADRIARKLADHPYMLLGAVTLFFYMGVEVMAGDTIGLFGAELGVKGFATLTSYTMGFMVCGYILGIVLIPRYVGQRTVLIACGIAGILVSLGIQLSSPGSSAMSAALWGWSGLPAIPDPIFFVAAMGLAHALVWPTVWPLAIDGLGALTARASAVLVMAIAGGAIMPLVFGAIAGRFGVQQGYWLAIPCYAAIVFYGWKGCRIGRE